ncbi:uncharacterized protein LOC133919075 [Phragmites australis]|uniref:uncharacterized protein LOC133919075 n=1 Tax=Phragmites australis TaxID=29695 RepID=UPI002D768D3F|nr:uncharacterized protein LOC133919075 [Phragmites australis]
MTSEQVTIGITSSAIVKHSSIGCEESEMISLSDDVVTEIILRLPVKFVARSMCVSKTWRATISDDYLRRRLPLHLSVAYFPADDPARGNAPRFACAAGGDRLLEDRDLGFFPFREGAVVCDACNGLFLLRSAEAPRFYVADPLTRRWVALPLPSRDARLSVLAFDPFSCPPRYRVINFTGWRGRVAEVEVFSSETWAWIARDADLGVPAGSLSGSMHFHGGAVYVLASDPDCIVRMDVDAGLACTVVELPEPTDGDGPVAHSGGRLHYVTGHGDLLKIWVLDDSPSTRQWQLKHAVKVHDVVGRACRGGEVRFLALHPEKDAVYMWSPWKLVEYDLTMKEITGAWEFGGKDHKGEKNRIVKTWLVPSWWYLSDCLSTGHGRCKISSS